MRDTELGMVTDDWEHLSGLVRAGRHNEAVKYLRAEIENATSSFAEAAAFEKLGAVFRMLNMPQEAIAALTRAIDAHGSANNPALTRKYVSLGLTFKSVGDLQKALEVYESGINLLLDRAIRIIAEDANDKSLSESQIEGKRVLNMSPEVFERIKMLCRLDPTFAALRNNMGTCYVELGEIGKAKEMFKEAIEFTPQGFKYDHPVNNLAELERFR